MRWSAASAIAGQRGRPHASSLTTARGLPTARVPVFSVVLCGRTRRRHRRRRRPRRAHHTGHAPRCAHARSGLHGLAASAHSSRVRIPRPGSPPTRRRPAWPCTCRQIRPYVYVSRATRPPKNPSSCCPTRAIKAQLQDFLRSRRPLAPRPCSACQRCAPSSSTLGRQHSVSSHIRPSVQTTSSQLLARARRHAPSTSAQLSPRAELRSRQRVAPRRHEYAV